MSVVVPMRAPALLMDGHAGATGTSSGSCSRRGGVAGGGMWRGRGGACVGGWAREERSDYVRRSGSTTHVSRVSVLVRKDLCSDVAPLAMYGT